MQKRYESSPLVVVERLLGLALVLVFSFLALGPLPLLVMFVVIGVPVGLIVYFQHKNTYILLKDDVLIFRTGLIFKKEQAIPFARINTFDMHSSVLERIFGACRLKIDTGSIVGNMTSSSNGQEYDTSDMNYVFSIADAEEIKAAIMARNSQNDTKLNWAQNRSISAASGEPLVKPGSKPITQPDDVPAQTTQGYDYGAAQQKAPVYNGVKPENVFTAGAGKLFLYAVTMLSSTITKAVVVALLSFASGALPFIFEETDMSLPQGILLAVCGLAALIVCVMLLAAVSTMLRMNDFTVVRQDNNILVSYGFLSKSNFTLPVRNIHAVVARQTLLMQLLGLCSVNVVTIGYSNNGGGLIFPVIKAKELQEFLSKILPEYCSDAELVRTDRHSARFYIFRPIFWWTLILAGLCVGAYFVTGWLVPALIAAAVILALVVFSSLMRQKNAGLGWEKNVIIIRSGGFTRSTTYIRTDAVQSVRTVSGILQRKYGVANYFIDYHAPQLSSVAAVRHLNATYADEVDEMVEQAF